jgi:hypothetical protein
LVSGLFVVEERGAHQLKGIAEPVELYRIARLSDARSRLAFIKSQTGEGEERTVLPERAPGG